MMDLLSNTSAASATAAGAGIGFAMTDDASRAMIEKRYVVFMFAISCVYEGMNCL